MRGKRELQFLFSQNRQRMCTMWCSFLGWTFSCRSHCLVGALASDIYVTWGNLRQCSEFASRYNFLQCVTCEVSPVSQVCISCFLVFLVNPWTCFLVAHWLHSYIAFEKHKTSPLAAARLEQNFAAELGGVFWLAPRQSLHVLKCFTKCHTFCCWYLIAAISLKILYLKDPQGARQDTCRSASISLADDVESHPSWQAAEAESPIPSVIQSGGRPSNTSSFGNITSQKIE